MYVGNIHINHTWMLWLNISFPLSPSFFESFWFFDLMWLWGCFHCESGSCDSMSSRWGSTSVCFRHLEVLLVNASSSLLMTSRGQTKWSGALSRLWWQNWAGSAIFWTAKGAKPHKNCEWEFWAPGLIVLFQCSNEPRSCNKNSAHFKFFALLKLQQLQLGSWNSCASHQAHDLTWK